MASLILAVRSAVRLATTECGVIAIRFRYVAGKPVVPAVLDNASGE
jgi:hypothetical protein